MSAAKDALEKRLKQACDEFVAAMISDEEDDAKLDKRIDAAYEALDQLEIAFFDRGECMTGGDCQEALDDLMSLIRQSNGKRVWHYAANDYDFYTFV